MKWTMAPLPKPGDTRREIKFAWKPVEFYPVKIWLQFYYLHYTWTMPMYGPGWWEMDWKRTWQQF